MNKFSYPQLPKEDRAKKTAREVMRKYYQDHPEKKNSPGFKFLQAHYAVKK